MVKILFRLSLSISRNWILDDASTCESISYNLPIRYVYGVDAPKTRTGINAIAIVTNTPAAAARFMMLLVERYKYITGELY